MEKMKTPMYKVCYYKQRKAIRVTRQSPSQITPQHTLTKKESFTTTNNNNKQTKQTIARLAHCVKLVRKKVNKQNVTGKIYLYSCIVEKK